MEDRKDLFVRQFGKATVRVWKIASIWHPYPWRFAIDFPGHRTHNYGGIPNYCETRHSALMRAYYRTKWMNEGTYDKHYSTPM